MRRRAESGWSAVPGRDAPVAIIAGQAATRLPEFLALRYERMRASPFAFLRGAASIMAADLASQPERAAAVQLCGDAHLANFATYASPEGNPVFDVNDFDETHPGPFDWDLKRLAASLVLSGREHGLSGKDCRALAARAARHYRRHMHHLAGLPPLEAWHSTIDLRAAVAGVSHHKLRRRLERRLRAAAEAALDHYGLVGGDGAQARIEDAGNTRHLPGYAPIIDAAFAAWPATLQPQYADLAARYRLVDRAFKVVGIGSIGTFCAIGLFIAADGAPLLLQLKQAQPSVLAGPLGAAPRDCQGERVVTGQRRLQAQSDIFLGWTPAPVDGRDFYVRRLKDGRLARIGAVLEADQLHFAAALCGRTLARAHGRAGDAARLTGAITAGGAEDAFAATIAGFAVGYADQTELDHAAFCAALDDGALPTSGQDPA